MVISMRRMSRFLRMLVFVAVFSFICFKVLGIVHDMIQPTNKYKEPVGDDAMKVNARPYVEVTSQTVWEELLARLGLFYEIGE